MRKSITVTISSEGRDKGKTFVVKEMSADQGERWAMRALLALTNAGVQLPDGAAEAGMAGIAAAGIEALGKLQFAAVEPLLEEMWECVQYQPPDVKGKKLPTQNIFSGDGSQIEEIATRMQLRMEVLKLHVNFSQGADTPFTAPLLRTGTRA